MLAQKYSTFDDSRAIRVLVVPIGENSLFDLHFHTVSQQREVSLTDLTKPSTWNNEVNTGFKHFAWWDNERGSLLFDYLRYDRVPNGPGDLDDYQSSRRVLMIMGLINYPELGENPMETISRELDYFTKRLPNVVLRRLFLFNYPFNSASKQGPFDGKLPSNLQDIMIVFPPDLLCENGISMVNVHLSVNMQEASCRIIQCFDEQMTKCEAARVAGCLPAESAHIPLCSFFDEIEDREAAKEKERERGIADQREANRSSGSGSERSTEDSVHSPSGRGSNFPSQRSSGSNASSSGTAVHVSTRTYKKRPAGRILKWMGDLSLQVCSPLDAIANYSSSIAECRAIGDQLWLAGALEGFAAAVLLLAQMKMPCEPALSLQLKAMQLPASMDKEGLPSVAVRCLMLAEERAAEAMSIYAQRMILCALEVECALRIARLHELASTVPAFSGASWPGHEKRALAYILRAASVPGLNSQQQIECTIEGGLICKNLGMHRKYALHLYIAALLSAENENMVMAHALLRMVAQQYGFHCSHSASLGSGEPTVEVDATVEYPERSWPAMRQQLLAHCAMAAKEGGDSRAAARFVSALLRQHIHGNANEIVLVSAWLSAIGPEERDHIMQEGNRGSNDGDAVSMRSKILQYTDGMSGSIGGGSAVGLAGLSVERGDGAMGSGLPSKSLSNAFNEVGTHPALSNGAAALAMGGFLSPTSPVTSSSSSSMQSDWRTQGQGGEGSEPPQNRKQNSSVSSGFFAMVQGSGALNGGGSSNGAFGNDSERIRSNPDLATLSQGLRGGRLEEGSLLHAILHLEAIEKISSGSSRNSLDATGSAAANARDLARVFPYSHAVHGNTTSSTFSSAPNSQSQFSSAVRTVVVPRIPDKLCLPLVQGPPSTSTSAVTFSTALEVGGEVQTIGQAVTESATLAMGRRSALQCTNVSSTQQLQAVSLLSQLAPQLAPGYHVALPNVLYSARPVLLPSGVRPERVLSPVVGRALSSLKLEEGKDKVPDLEMNSQSGGLFYNPFLAGFSKKKKKKSSQDEAANGDAQEAFWAVGCMCLVEAVFFNPLLVPLHFTSARVVLEGVAHATHPISISVPSRRQRHTIQLPVMPLEVGSLRVMGLELRVGSAIHYFPVDSLGFACHDGNFSDENTFGGKGDEDSEYNRARSHSNEGADINGMKGGVPSHVRGHLSHRFVTATTGTTSTSLTTLSDPCAVNTTITVCEAGPTLHIDIPDSFARTGVEEVDSAQSDGSALDWIASSSFTALVPSSSPIRPLCLYTGETVLEWVRVTASGRTGNMTESAIDLADLKVTAHQWEIKPGSSSPTVRKFVLHAFSGALRDSEDGVEMEGEREGACVTLVGAGYASDQGSGMIPSHSLPLPLRFPLPMQGKSSTLCLQLQWQQRLSPSSHFDSPSLSSQTTVLGVVLELQAAGLDGTVRAVEALRKGAAHASLVAGSSANATVGSDHEEDHDPDHGNETHSYALHASERLALLGSGGLVTVRRACVVSPLVTLRGLTVQEATLDTGVARRLPLSVQEKAKVVSAIAQALCSETCSSTVSSTIVSGMRLRSLDPLPVKVLVVHNASACTAWIGPLAPITHTETETAPLALISSTRSDGYWVPPRSTRNLTVSPAEIYNLLGQQDQSQEKKRFLQWSLEGSRSAYSTNSNGNNRRGTVPVTLAPALCSAPPALVLHIKVGCVEGEPARVGVCCPISIGVTPREGEDEIAWMRTEAKGKWELLVVAIVCTNADAGTWEWGGAESMRDDAVVLTGFVHTHFTSAHLPLSHNLGSWFTQAGTYKVFALVRSSFASASEWFGPAPVCVSVQNE